MRFDANIPKETRMQNDPTLEMAFPQEGDIPEAHRPKTIDQKEYLIGGEIRTWNGAMEEVLSPILIRSDKGLTARRLGSYPSLGEKEANDALAAAVKAWDNGRGEWPTMGMEARIERLERFVEAMRGCREDVVRLIMWEICKNAADAAKEFDRTVEYVIATIEAAKELDRASSRFQAVEGIVAQVRRSPMGVTLCMGPFNYPLNETFTTVIPALVMGNPVIFKPAKFGTLLFAPLLKAFRDCFPAGVINTLYGDGKVVVPPVMSSGKVDVFAFIGSARVANILEKQHPKPNRLRSVLGLGAKNPGIVLDDANLELAAKECALGALSYNGQRCTALKVIFVQRNVVDAFLPKLVAAVDALKPGMPWEEGVKITPLPETGKTGYMRELIDDALSKGAKIVNERGGATAGTLMKPAVLYPVAPGSRVYVEEQFGPVVPVVPFDDVSEPIRYIIESEYGQQASLFGTNPDDLAALIDPLANQVSRININSQCQRGPDAFPFTGRKDSAEGTLSITDALRVFSIRTLVAAKQERINKEILADITRERKSSFLSTDYLF
jgi:glyceraldehyde-3-phosphate dehydrogenase (NADP+)